MEMIKDFRIPADIWPATEVENPYIPGERTILTVDTGFTYAPYMFGARTDVYPIALATMKETVRDAEATGRWAIARAFAEHVRDDPRVREVWYDDAPDDAALTLIVTQASLDEELHFEAILSAVMDSIDHPFGGFLRIYAEDHGVPDNVRVSARLLP
jgi:hypothetical protein